MSMLMVTKTGNENESHFRNFLLKNKYEVRFHENEVRFCFKDQKRISISFSFWLTIRTEKSKNKIENDFILEAISQWNYENLFAALLLMEKMLFL